MARIISNTEDPVLNINLCVKLVIPLIFTDPESESFVVQHSIKAMQHSVYASCKRHRWLIYYAASITWA